MAGEQGAPAGGGQGRAAGPGRDFSALANPGIRGLASYDPGHDIVALRNRAGEQGLLELGGNESAWGPSLLALAALRDRVALGGGAMALAASRSGGDAVVLVRVGLLGAPLLTSRRPIEARAVGPSDRLPFAPGRCARHLGREAEWRCARDLP